MKRIFIAILLFIFIILSAGSPISSAFADSYQDFLDSQGISFYNKNDTNCSLSGTGSTASVSADATANAKTIFEFLISTNFTTNGNKPMTAIEAAGVLGNIQSESDFNPATIENGKPYNQTEAMDPTYDIAHHFGYGFGIIQWSFARRVNLLNFTNTKGTEWTDMNTQLAFLQNELDTTDDIFAPGDGFTTATTPGDAANIWNLDFEGSSDSSNNRAKQAGTWYNEFKSLAPAPTTSSDSPSDCGSSNGGGTGSGQCSATGCTTGDGTAASVVSAAMSMVLPDSVKNPANGHNIGAAACNSYCGGGPAQPAAYATALKQYNIPPSVADQYYGACCATFVSTVLQVAGVENNFATCGAKDIHDYMAAHPELFQLVASGVTSITSAIKPGDILSNDSDVYIYIGGNNVAGASYSQRMPDLQPAWQDGPRDVYRVIKAAS